VKVLGNKSFGGEAIAGCRVQDLGLPVRWNDLINFSSDVSGLVLLSERGRTHGSIWGEFLHSYWMRSGLRHDG